MYRFGSYVPVPGVDLGTQLQILRDQAREGGGVLQLLAAVLGSARSRSSAVFALGIMPYITSSIIMQVLTVVIRSSSSGRQQGAVGQRKITQWTRYLTIGISVLQSTSWSRSCSRAVAADWSVTGAVLDLLPDCSSPGCCIIVTTMTAGTAMHHVDGRVHHPAGHRQRHVADHLRSVVSGLPRPGRPDPPPVTWGMLLVVVAILIVILAAIVFIEQGQRSIPVQFAKRVVGRRHVRRPEHLHPAEDQPGRRRPDDLRQLGASTCRCMLSQVLPSERLGCFGVSVGSTTTSSNTINPIFYVVIFGLMIMGFSYFYTSITFDPAKQADTLRKQGGFIPGIRPGPQTERHLSRILSRIVLPGALFIAFVALVPDILLANILPGDEARFAFGGISLLIAVGVSLETMKQIDSQLMMRNYEGFLK
jgi:preprotein translocase subunit SecY